MIRIVNVKHVPKAERGSVCYCGRAWAGWLSSPWANPFRPRSRPGGHSMSGTLQRQAEAIEECLMLFRDYFEDLQNHDEVLADLWDACEHGAKPLGCWCVDATVGDGSPIVCHAQILGKMLVERFGNGKVEDGVGEGASS